MNQQELPTETKPTPSALPYLMLGGLAAGVLMAAAVIVYGSPSGSANRLPTPIPDAVIEGEPAPDFEGILVNGSLARLSEFRGSVVAVNFWTTWCGPCKVEMPMLQEANAKGQLVVLAVNAGEKADVVQSYMDDLGLTFPSVLDEKGDIIDLYAVRVFPTTVLVDAQGVVIAEHYGPLTPELLTQYLED